MNKIVWIMVGLLFLAMSSAADDDQTFPGIKALMTPEEYEAAGLQSLSAKELEALNQFLIRYTAEDAPILLAEDAEIKQAVQEQEIVSVIKQPFKGWSGKTVFVLENGQVWKQRHAGRYSYPGNNPEVKITKNFM
ncbi:MAG: hypothetical protein AAGI44_14050, partial [Pseudomonadota bacterium]